MCTLIALWQLRADAPLVMAANRDEFLERPTQPLSVWRPEGGRWDVAAGRDLRSGGTWFGVGRRVTAALTNHRAGARSAPGSRSRGELVTRALQATTVGDLEADLHARPVGEYGPFHLLVADRVQMRWLTNRHGNLESYQVEPGLHVLGNHGMDALDDPVVRHVQASLAETPGLPAERLQSHLQQALAEHGPGAPCVHRDGYGTRSASILFRGGPHQRLLVAEGRPCETPWQDRSEYLETVAPDG